MNIKNEGDTPCSTYYAAQKLEPTSIDLAASQQWQMEGADYMEEKPGAKSKKGKKCIKIANTKHGFYAEETLKERRAMKNLIALLLTYGCSVSPLILPIP